MVVGLVLSFLVWTVVSATEEIPGSCTFPEYLQRPTVDGKERTWITETQFLNNTSLWDTQLELTVKEDQITGKLKFKAQCNEYSETVPCLHSQILYRRSCVADEGNGKYRLHHRDDGGSYYTCIRFIERGKNIVQIWTGPQHEDNNEELCNDQLLKRNEWPWLAPKLDEWSFCPLTGGFDFRTYVYKRKKLCNKAWRPSRIESECVAGEGLSFTFPEKACSPFEDHKDNVEMQCWGHWEENDFIFIIAAETDKMPQYVLRFPRDWESTERDFNVDMYFSPLCPLERHGAPSGGIEVRQAELKMKRSESGMCFDESDTCTRHADRGECTQSPPHEYANYCKRSCGICNLLPSTRPECRFPPAYQGEWNLFDRNRLEHVRVHSGRVEFSHMGEFICKAKHWSTNNYKMLSYYMNGCRPRYTCIHFTTEEEETTLQYQISRSDLSDTSFQLCEFHDDPSPLNGLIRSAKLKILIPASITVAGSCGLHGTILVNATSEARIKCAGTLSDWDRNACDSKPEMTLTLPGCNGGYDIIKNFTCVSYINMHDGLNFLITKDASVDEEYNCWMIQTYSERMNYKPWKEAYMLPRAQCGLETDMDLEIQKISQLTLHIPTDKVHAPCGSIGQGDHPKPPNGDSSATMGMDFQLSCVGLLCLIQLVMSGEYTL